MSEGRKSSEHARAWRAEVVGALLVVLGLAGVPAFGWQAVVALVAGAALIGATAVSYAHARSRPKEAAQRPRVVSAPK